MVEEKTGKQITPLYAKTNSDSYHNSEWTKTSFRKVT